MTLHTYTNQSYDGLVLGREMGEMVRDKTDQISAESLQDEFNDFDRRNDKLLQSLAVK